MNSPRFAAAQPRRLHQADKDHRDGIRRLPAQGAGARETRGVFMDWRDRLALRSRRQADYAWTVLARVLSCGKGSRASITGNPCERGGRLYAAPASISSGRIEDEKAFLELSAGASALAVVARVVDRTAARRSVRLPVVGLRRHAYPVAPVQERAREARRQVYSHNSGRSAAQGRARRGAASKDSPMILVNVGGRPWTSEGFRASWGKACKKAGIVKVTFNDLRGTAVTRLALVGCSEAEIVTITGHSFATCARSSTSIICTAIRRSPRAPSASSKGLCARADRGQPEQNLQNDLQTVCNSNNKRRGAGPNGCLSWIHIEPCAALLSQLFRQIFQEDVRELCFAA